jgi:hypothetical protein
MSTEEKIATLADEGLSAPMISERLLTVAETLASTIKTEYANQFGQAIEQYRKEKGPFPERIVTHLESKGWFKPEIEILTTTKARERLTNFGFVYEADNWDDKNVLVLFNLPKPLAKYWFKSDDGRDGEEEETVQQKQKRKIYGMAIEWGYFYWTLASIPWNSREQILEKYDKVEIIRINEIGDHSDNYYYLFKLVEHSQEEWEAMKTDQDEDMSLISQNLVDLLNIPNKPIVA